MARGRLFGARPVGAVSVVEAPVSASYARKARVAFFVVGATVALLVGASVSVVSGVLPGAVLGALAGLAAGLVAGVLVRVWPVLRALWWWSIEITAVVVVVAGCAWLARSAHVVVALAVLLAVLGLVLVVGPVRRFVAAWGWCVVVRHRLRFSFAEFVRTVGRDRSGRLPLVLWARPTPAGERVWLWLRPGLDLTDLDGKAGKLAVACWAGEARIVRASARFAALVRVDITRRDPLTGVVASPLSAWLHGGDPAPVSPGMPPLGLDLLDVPEPQAAPRERRR